MEVWSQLPQGSGLGGSSLVAGTLVAAVAALLGHPLPSHTTLIHATLCIEQWLTTGGGWQDQVLYVMFIYAWEFGYYFSFHA